MGAQRRTGRPQATSPSPPRARALLPLEAPRTHSSCKDKPWTVFQERDFRALEDRFLGELRQGDRPEPQTSLWASMREGRSQEEADNLNCGRHWGWGQVRLLPGTTRVHPT